MIIAGWCCEVGRDDLASIAANFKQIAAFPNDESRMFAVVACARSCFCFVHGLLWFFSEHRLAEHIESDAVDDGFVLGLDGAAVAPVAPCGARHLAGLDDTGAETLVVVDVDRCNELFHGLIVFRFSAKCECVAFCRALAMRKPGNGFAFPATVSARWSFAFAIIDVRRLVFLRPL